FCVYILASKRNGTLYIEVTSHLATRVWEKQLKKWRRAWKIELIEARNPDWPDLYDEIV
ncbi:MAG: GIY-YIG nuclease family protein, partial [Deltaproteobacteria bacterium]|nr:GIY-YIG nuclease family protein [Deltaproteobacteria bacterium]